MTVKEKKAEIGYITGKENKGSMEKCGSCEHRFMTLCSRYDFSIGYFAVCRDYIPFRLPENYRD